MSLCRIQTQEKALAENVFDNCKGGARTTSKGNWTKILSRKLK